MIDAISRIGAEFDRLVALGPEEIARRSFAERVVHTVVVAR